MLKIKRLKKENHRMKEFNTTGLCNPNKHYMIDISDKLENIKKLVEKEKVFYNK